MDRQRRALTRSRPAAGVGAVQQRTALTRRRHVDLVRVAAQGCSRR
ncbi:putative leader peptide [Saccharothrix sp. BKS2]